MPTMVKAIRIGDSEEVSKPAMFIYETARLPATRSDRPKRARDAGRVADLRLSNPAPTFCWRSSSMRHMIIPVRQRRQLRLLAGVAAAIACSEVGGPTTAPVADVIVNIAPDDVHVGSVTQASVLLRDSNGNALTGREVTWSSSDAIVAAVSGTGAVTALSPGTATITATSEGKSGSVTVNVLHGVAELTLRMPQPGLAVGFSIEAADTLRDAGGNVLAGRSVTWSSSNTAVATVTQSGVVTGVGRGTAEITATSEGKSGSATVDVVVIKQRSLALGVAHTCAISVDGAAYCWGSNYNGQLGDGDSTQNTRHPSRVKGGLKFAAFATGSDITYGLSTDGQFYCWGAIPCDPFARKSRWDEFVGPAVTSPRRVATPRAIEVLSSSHSVLYSPACAVGARNVAYCWGTNTNGELGIGIRSTDTILAPDPPVTGGHAFSDIGSASTGHACAITTAGTAYCWGFGGLGALGDGSSTQSSVPVRVAGNHVFKSVGAGRHFSCGLTTGGQALCWGSNRNGTLGAPTGNCLGQDTVPCSATPVGVTYGYVFESLSVGTASTCGVTSVGDVYCWGAGFWPTPIPFRSVLASDPGGVMFRTVAVGGGHACAVATSGDMYCRGGNNYGQLGNGTMTASQEPTRVLGGINFRAP